MPQTQEQRIESAIRKTIPLVIRYLEKPDYKPWKYGVLVQQADPFIKRFNAREKGFIVSTAVQRAFSTDVGLTAAAKVRKAKLARAVDHHAVGGKLISAGNRNAIRRTILKSRSAMKKQVAGEASSAKYKYEAWKDGKLIWKGRV